MEEGVPAPEPEHPASRTDPNVVVMVEPSPTSPSPHNKMTKRKPPALTKEDAGVAQALATFPSSLEGRSESYVAEFIISESADVAGGTKVLAGHVEEEIHDEEATYAPSASSLADLSAKLRDDESHRQSGTVDFWLARRSVSRDARHGLSVKRRA